MTGTEIYLDTSVIGGYFDDEFKAETRELWSLMEKGVYRFVTSVVTLNEVQKAPVNVQNLLSDTFSDEALLEGNEDSDELAQAYMEQGIVPVKYYDDAQHVAICTIARIEYLVSWNFKHLANVQREKGFNAVNLLRGFREVRIVSPKSLVYGYEKEI
jgi:predicted nucleic acid-binding protein